MAEQPVYPPSPEFVKHANVKGMEAYRALYKRAEEQPAEFWGELAEKELFWFEKWSKTFEWNAPFVQWFVGGKTNVSYNCIDRHLKTHRKNKVAILWEGEPGDQRMITYQELHRLVSRFANVLKARGLKTGDRAIVYMPMIPELPIALLACARLGIIHSVVFGGFSAEALKARIQDLEAQVVITADGGWRRGKEVKLKPAVDDAVADCPTVRDVIVYRRTGTAIEMKAGRDLWWHELDEKAGETCDAVPLDSETPLYVLYTSGTTGKPKGVRRFPMKSAQDVEEMRRTLGYAFGLKDGMRTLVSSPLYHAGPASYLRVAMATMKTSGLVVIHPRFDAEKTLQAIEEHRIDRLWMVPTMFVTLLKLPAEIRSKYNVSSLKYIIHTAAPCPAACRSPSAALAPAAASMPTTLRRDGA